MEINRMNDMLERYGEICTQKVAAKILNIQPRSVHRMMAQGRLRRVGHRVDVRSIVDYIDKAASTAARRSLDAGPRGEIQEGTFFAAANRRRRMPNRG